MSCLQVKAAPTFANTFMGTEQDITVYSHQKESTLIRACKLYIETT